MPNQEFNSSGFLCSFGFPFQSLCLSTNSVLFIFFMVDIDLNLSGFVQFIVICFFPLFLDVSSVLVS